MKLICLDTETTGLLKPESAALNLQPHIIDVGMVVVLDEKGTKKTYSQLVKAPCKVSSKITRITGISDEMLAEAPTFAEVADDIQELLADADILVAHNAYFDTSILKYEFKRLGKELLLPKQIECTAESFAPLFGYFPKLTELYEEVLNKPLDEKHRALSDATDLYEICAAIRMGGFSWDGQSAAAKPVLRLIKGERDEH